MPEGIAAKYEYRGNDGGNELLPKLSGHYWMNGYAMWRPKKCPYGVVGDRLYLQEPYQITTERGNGFMYGIYLDDEKVFDIKLNEDEWSKWANRKWPHHKTSARFMYKSLARTFLEMMGIRAERVQDISNEDIRAEGAAVLGCVTHRVNFHSLWDSINAKPKPANTNPYTNQRELCKVAYPWDDVKEETVINIKTSKFYGCKVYIVGNPWVFVISFKKI